MLSHTEAAFVNNVREPLQRNLIAAIEQEYRGLGWPIVVLTLVENLGITMEVILRSNPEFRAQFIGHIDALRLCIEAPPERGN